MLLQFILKILSQPSKITDRGKFVKMLQRFRNQVQALLWVAIFATTSAHAAFPLRCIDDTTNLIVGGTELNTCRNLLPKCSTLHNEYKSRVLNNLSLKIYGYLKNLDLDLSKTTKTDSMGKAMPFPICRVTGPKIKYNGSGKNEFIYRNPSNSVHNGGKQEFTGASCGEYPFVSINKDARKVFLRFQNNYGTAVTSMMLGAMPYEIRAEAYTFFQAVQKPSELDAKLTAPEIEDFRDQANEIQAEIDAVFAALPPDSKAACTSPEFQNLNARCMGTGEPIPMDAPALRLCSTAKTSMLLQQGSVSPLIELQIIRNAQIAFDKHFDQFLKTGSPLWDALVQKSSQDSGWWDCTLRGEGQRKCAANVASAVIGTGSYRVDDDYNGLPSNYGPSRYRTGRRFMGFYLDPGASVTRAHLPPNSAPYLRGGFWLSGTSWVSIISGLLSPLTWLLNWANTAFSDALASENFGGVLNSIGAKRLTLSSGLAGMIERIARVDICEQNAVDAYSAKCDETLIPDKPVDVSW